MQKCAFRLDDITPDMNWDHFEAIKKIFEKYHIFPLLGVVPDNRDNHLRVGEAKTDFWQRMKSLQQEGFTIAQHGYCHVYETEEKGLLGINPFSEFAGLPYDVQYEKLKKGKAILEEQGILTDIFMAPGHTYDKNTLKALKNNGFHFVTDGYSKVPYRMDGLTFLPSRMSGPGKIKGTDTICLHLNGMNEEQFRQLDSFMEQNRRQLCSYSELLNSTTAGNRTIPVMLDERIHLLQYHIRNQVAGSAALQRYLQKTDANSKWIKLCKRIFMFPLLFYCFLPRRKERQKS